VSAAQELMDYVNSSFTETGRRHIQTLLDRVEAEHAHKLAEKIRDHIGRDDYPSEPQPVRDIVKAYRYAADSIDPEVE